MVLVLSSLVLGTYTITLALTESSGPWGLLERLRNVKWVDDMGLLNCSLCVSFWVSIIACLFVDRLDLMPLVWGGSHLLSQLVLAVTVR